jgi:hypothetical protein
MSDAKEVFDRAVDIVNAAEDYETLVKSFGFIDSKDYVKFIVCSLGEYIDPIVVKRMDEGLDLYEAAIDAFSMVYITLLVMGRESEIAYAS